jgi:hypothetical protein
MLVNEQSHLDGLIETLLAEVSTDAGHRLPPERRRDLYTALHEAHTSISTVIFGHLGCAAAERVLPIFENFSSEDMAPRRMLLAAKGILEGEADHPTALRTLESGYHSSGNSWGYEEKDIPTSAWLAANAAYHSLVEALGTRPLSFLPEYHKAGKPTVWADEDLCWLDLADTASVASMATATNTDSSAPDAQRLLTFWKWWLLEALPTSIEKAEESAYGNTQ